MASMQKNLIIAVFLLNLRVWNLQDYKLIQELTQFSFSSIDQGMYNRTLRKYGQI